MSFKYSIFVDELLIRIIYVVDILREYIDSRKFWRQCNLVHSGSVLLRFTKIPGVFQVFSRLILNFPGVKTIPILSIADRISYKYVCYLS